MKVSLFVTCLSDLFFPNVAKSVVEILEDEGVEVEVPLEQTCCGQIAFNSGYWNDAKKAAKQFIKTFQDKEFIVTPSGSCAYMVNKHFIDLFEDKETREKIAEISERTYEFSEFLVNVLGVSNLDSSLHEIATYHPSCHTCRGLGVKEEPLKLIKEVEGLEVRKLPNSEDCCGFGGTFSMKFGAVSASMAEEKLKHVKDTGAELLIGSDMGCLMHLEGYARKNNIKIKTMHVAEVLASGRDRD